LREVYLDRGFDGGGVRLDHPLALDGHRERAGKIRRGDHALGADQWQIFRCAAQLWRAGVRFITANAVELVARRRRCGHTEHGHCDEQQGRACVQTRPGVPGRGRFVFTAGDHHAAISAVAAAAGITVTASRLCR